MKNNHKLFITVATDCNRAMPFISSVRSLGYEPLVLGIGGSFPSLFWKIKYMREFLRSARGSIVFSDAYDSIVVRDFEVPSDTLFSAERNNYPDPKLEYPECVTPYRYLNSGGYCGDAVELLRILDEVSQLSVENDQLAFARFHVKNPGRIRLDHKCELFQCLYGSEQDVDKSGINRITGHRPCIIHNNGGFKAPDELFLCEKEQ